MNFLDKNDWENKNKIEKENGSEDFSPKIEDIEEDNKDDLKKKVRCFWENPKYAYLLIL